MSDPVQQLIAAEAQSAAARARLSRTLAVLQQRLRPERLARDARQELAEAGSAAAQQAMAKAKSHPGMLTGAVALAGLFLARHRVAALLRRPRATPAPAASLDSKSRRRQP